MIRFVTILMAIITLCVTCSCRTSKNIQRDENRAERMEHSLTSVLKDSFGMSMKQAILNTNESLRTIRLEQTKVVWSPPDSSGKQYPLQTTRTNIVQKDTSKQVGSENTDVRSNEITQTHKSEGNTASSSHHTEERIKELGWWQVHKEQVYLALLLIAMLTIYTIKTKKFF